MASSSEIEKLERRCAENPHGLTFAPLAEAYRKHGDLDRALEVLRAGRELHPDYIPASIVLGRCHLDRGELAEAERSFAHVLTLDPENVIALKALADLAEREGRAVQAERWLNLLLAVDPSNEEARAQLDRIRTGEAVTAVEPAALEPAEVEPAALEPWDVEPVTLEQMPQAGSPIEQPDAFAAEPSPTGAEFEPAALDETGAAEKPGRFDEPARFEEPADVEEPAGYEEPGSYGDPISYAEPVGHESLAGAQQAAPEESAAADEPAPGEEQTAGEEPVIEPVAGEHSVMSTSAAEVASDGSAERAADAADFDVLIEQENDIVLTPAADSDYRSEIPGALPEPPTADDDGDADPFAGVPDSFDDTRPGPDVFDGAEFSDPAASDLQPVPDLTAEFDPAENGFTGSAGPAFPEALALDTEPSEPETLYSDPGTPDPTPVVTESMAELYLRQGHRADALAIYRRLAERRPGDDRLAKLVADLTAEVDAAPAVTRAYAATQTGGRSVAALLRSVLSERLPAATPGPEPFPATEAAPAFRSAEEVLTDADDQGEPTRPADDHLTLGAVFGEDEAGAPPAVASPESSAGSEQGGGLSFDEFFGAPPAVESDQTRTAPPAPAGDPDDLDQFHAWLQSLKR